MQNALGLGPDDMFGGDAFTIRFEIVRTDGARYSAADNSGTLTGSYFSSPFEYTSTLVCAPKPIQEGTWRVVMQDAFGDGWQPTTADGGGPGLIVTLGDGTTFEIGLCTPYEDPGYDCVDESSAGTDIITIPAGITSAEWIFNGDFWGEMSFTITSPSGNVVATGSPGTSAGPIALNLCNE